MKLGKKWSSILFVLLLLEILTLSVADAQNMSIWVGTWFKVTFKSSGYNVDYPGISKSNESLTVYLKIWSVDEVNKILYCDAYFFEDGAWGTDTLNFNFLGHHSWEFIAYLYETSNYVENDVNHTEFTAFTLLIQGTIKQGALASGKMISLGGTHWKAVWNAPGYEHYNGNQYTLTGSLIKPSKVPVPTERILR